MIQIHMLNPARLETESCVNGKGHAEVGVPHPSKVFQPQGQKAGYYALIVCTMYL